MLMVSGRLSLLRPLLSVVFVFAVGSSCAAKHQAVHPRARASSFAAPRPPFRRIALTHATLVSDIWSREATSGTMGATTYPDCKIWWKPGC
jgi:hypothetical protein